MQLAGFVVGIAVFALWLQDGHLEDALFRLVLLLQGQLVLLHQEQQFLVLAPQLLVALQQLFLLRQGLRQLLLLGPDDSFQLLIILKQPSGILLALLNLLRVSLVDLHEHFDVGHLVLRDQIA